MFYALIGHFIKVVFITTNTIGRHSFERKSTNGLARAISGIELSDSSIHTTGTKSFRVHRETILDAYIGRTKTTRLIVTSSTVRAHNLEVSVILKCTHVTILQSSVAVLATHVTKFIYSTLS